MYAEIMSHQTVLQLFFFLVIKAPHFYLLSIDISGILILPTYIFSAMFMVKSSFTSSVCAGSLNYFPFVIVGVSVSDKELRKYTVSYTHLIPEISMLSK